MGAKKKKKGGKKSKKDKEKGAEGEEEKKEESADTIVPLPKYGWIKIKVSQLKSCNLSSNAVCTANEFDFLYSYVYAMRQPHKTTGLTSSCSRARKSAWFIRTSFSIMDESKI